MQAVRRLLLLLTTVVFLAVPSTAAARTIELGWREHDGAGVMSFGVTSLTLTERRRSVRASFVNHSSQRLKIERRFALLGYASRDPGGRHYSLSASSFRPALPATLGAGRRWSGTFGGAGRPLRGSYLRVLFGRFSGNPSPLPDFPGRFSWLTDHVHRLR